MTTECAFNPGTHECENCIGAALIEQVIMMMMITIIIIIIDKLPKTSA